MKKWLTSLFLLFALATGVLAGMPLHSERMENSQMMECCDKAKQKDNAPEAAAKLCCALNCTNSAPTSSNSQFNFSPSFVIAFDSVIKQIALLIEKKQLQSPSPNSFERQPQERKFQPKYIQHHSFLI